MMEKGCFQSQQIGDSRNALVEAPGIPRMRDAGTNYHLLDDLGYSWKPLPRRRIEQHKTGLVMHCMRADGSAKKRPSDPCRKAQVLQP